jgi:hypothetical protein
MLRAGAVMVGAVTVIAVLLVLLAAVKWSNAPNPAQSTGGILPSSHSSPELATPTATTNPCPGGLIYLPRSGLCTHGADPADQNR